YRSVIEPCRRRLGNVLTALLPAAEIRISVLRSTDPALYVDPEVARPMITPDPAGRPRDIRPSPFCGAGVSPAGDAAETAAPQLPQTGTPPQRLVSCLCRAEQLESKVFRS